MKSIVAVYLVNTEKETLYGIFQDMRACNEHLSKVISTGGQGHFRKQEILTVVEQIAFISRLVDMPIAIKTLEGKYYASKTREELYQTLSGVKSAGISKVLVDIYPILTNSGIPIKQGWDWNNGEFIGDDMEDVCKYLRDNNMDELNCQDAVPMEYHIEELQKGETLYAIDEGDIYPIDID